MKKLPRQTWKWRRCIVRCKASNKPGDGNVTIPSFGDCQPLTLSHSLYPLRMSKIVAWAGRFSATTAWTDICSCNICIPHFHVGYAGDRAPKVGALGDAGAGAEQTANQCTISYLTEHKKSPLGKIRAGIMFKVPIMADCWRTESALQLYLQWDLPMQLRLAFLVC